MKSWLLFYFCVVGLVAHAREVLPPWHALHDKGAKGDAAAVLECIRTLEQVLENEPGNQLARVYLGSAYTLRSRDLWIGPQKLETLQRGGALMDEAVAAAPEDPRVRLIRAVNSLRLPRIFNRRKLALEDFEKLVAELDCAQLEPLEKQAVYYFSGLAFRGDGQKQRALELWNKALAIDSQNEVAALIRKEL